MTSGVVIELFDFVRTRPLPAAVRVRIALDVADASHGLGAKRPRVTLEAVRIDEAGLAHAPPCVSHGHLATLLWEIVAGRLADTDDLPWSDPAEDVPPAVLDTFASLQLRPARDIAELRRRFGAGVRSHAASHDEVVEALSSRGSPTAPAPAPAPITLRAPAMQIEALRTLSAADEAKPEAATENLIATRVCPVVSMPAVFEPVEEPPRSTLEPWNAPAPVDAAETSGSLVVEPELPRRRKTWPIVAASLAGALVLVGLAGRQRFAPASSNARAAVATEATSVTAPPAPAPVPTADLVATTSAPSAAASAPSTRPSAGPPALTGPRPAWAARPEVRRAEPVKLPAAEGSAPPAAPPSDGAAAAPEEPTPFE